MKKQRKKIKKEKEDKKDKEMKEDNKKIKDEEPYVFEKCVHTIFVSA